MEDHVTPEQARNFLLNMHRKPRIIAVLEGTYSDPEIKQWLDLLEPFQPRVTDDLEFLIEKWPAVMLSTFEYVTKMLQKDVWPSEIHLHL